MPRSFGICKILKQNRIISFIKGVFQHHFLYGGSHPYNYCLQNKTFEHSRKPNPLRRNILYLHNAPDKHQAPEAKHPHIQVYLPLGHLRSWRSVSLCAAAVLDFKKLLQQAKSCLRVAKCNRCSLLACSCKKCFGSPCSHSSIQCRRYENKMLRTLCLTPLPASLFPLLPPPPSPVRCIHRPPPLNCSPFSCDKRGFGK